GAGSFSSRSFWCALHLRRKRKLSVRHRTGATLASPRLRDVKHCSSLPRVLQIQRLVGVRSLARTAPASMLALALVRWSSTTRMRTRPVALLPCCSTGKVAETQLWEQPQWSITTATRKATDHSTMLSAPLL